MRVDVVIVGGGVAGAAAAIELIRRGRDVVVFCGTSATASRLPWALVHPFAGRSARSSGGVEVFSAARRWYERLAVEAPVPILTTMMIRPVRNRSDRLWRSLLGNVGANRRDGIEVEWLDAGVAELTHRGPVIQYSPCYSLPGANIVDHWLAIAGREGAILAEEVRVVERDGPRWCVRGEASQVVADAVVVAAGSRAPEWIPSLALDVVVGETLLISGENSVPFAVSHGGVHWAPTAQDGVMSVGATRHAPTIRLTDGEVVTQLMESPLLDGHFDIVSTWRGRRVVYSPDRRPLVGPEPSRRGLYFAVGYGSRGFLWAPYLAERLADCICHAVSIPDAFSISRANIGAISLEPLRQGA